MPKIRAFTPPWLSATSPDGRGLFSPSASTARSSSRPPSSTASPRASLNSSASKAGTIPGPRRTIARRGTEVFVACGKEIRWADLAAVKSAWEASHDSASGTRPACRILKPPVTSDIRQLIVSPTANFMAVLTTHTVHICLLPDPSHLVAAEDADAPLKARFLTLGPTTHTAARQPVVAAVWHPLGVNGAALVTVTKDAVVRLWEISFADRWSFDTPSLSIDTKALADGMWLDDDFSASTFTPSFSPDLFEMEVAAASFGSRTAGGWSSMTLYLGMVGGDVYALCPLLPKRFAPPPTLIPALSVAVVSNLAAIEDDASATPQSKQLARQQLDWMGQIDSQMPTVVEATLPHTGGEPSSAEVYSRPTHPGAVPRLQGPLIVDIDDAGDANGEGASANKLCDILVIGQKLDLDFLGGDDDEDLADVLGDTTQEGLSLPIICALTTNGQVHICLDLVGVEAQWLPQRSQKSSLSTNGRSKSAAALDDSDASGSRSLLMLQVVDVVRKSEQRPGSWCTFSPDVTSRYSFLVNHPRGITYISLASWVFRLEQELQASTETGANFRLRQIVTGESTKRQRVYTHSRDEVLATSIVMLDPDLGYFLLSATEHAPLAITFELPGSDDDDDLGLGLGTGASTIRQALSSTMTAATPAVGAAAAGGEGGANDADALAGLDLWRARPAFEMPPELLTPSELAKARNMLFSSRYQMLRNQEVRLSAATLAIFTSTHQIVGQDTGRLNQAAAQIFTKLEDLPIHLHEQVEATYAVKRRIDMIAGEDEDAQDVQDAQHDGPAPDDIRLRQRLQRAQDRQRALGERMDLLRQRFGRATSTRLLSDKERSWAQEVQALETSLDKAEAAGVAIAPVSLASSKAAGDIGLRVRKVRQLWDDLARQAEALMPSELSTAASTEDVKSSTASLRSAHSGTGTGTGTDNETPSPPPSVLGHHRGASELKVPPDVRKAKMAQVTQLLERETAMVEAVTARLTRLGV